MIARTLGPWIAAVLCLAPLGCGGPSLGTITGKVTVAGQPLKGGTISFVLKEKPETPPVSGIIQEDGSFTVPEVPYGELLVAVVPAPPTAGPSTMSPKERKRRIDQARREGVAPPIEAQGPSAPPPAAEEIVPARLQDPLTTDLVFTLDAPSSEYFCRIP